jgi:transposase, IS30 family
MKNKGLDTVSYETIYQMIYANYQGLATYQQYLRQSQKKRRQRKKIYSKRGVISGRIGIEYQPEVADLKMKTGHWESDTVIGVSHIGEIVTHDDKASKF